MTVKQARAIEWPTFADWLYHFSAVRTIGTPIVCTARHLLSVRPDICGSIRQRLMNKTRIRSPPKRAGWMPHLSNSRPNYEARGEKVRHQRAVRSWIDLKR